MEILDYLRVGALRGRWLALVLVVPLVAGLAASVLGTTAPARFRATGLVPVADVLAPDDPSAAAVQLAGTRFSTVFESNQVADDVAQALGSTGRDRPTSLRTRSLGHGLVEVSLSADAESSATRGLDLAVRSSLRSLLEAKRTGVQAEQDAAQASLQSREDELDALNRANGSADIASAVQAARADLLSLQDRVGTATTPATVASLQALLDEQTHAVAGLEAALPAYWRATAAVDGARQRVADATDSLARLDAQLRWVDGPDPILQRPATAPGSKAPQMATAAVVAMAAAGMLVIIAFAVWTRRRSARAGAPLPA